MSKTPEFFKNLKLNKYYKVFLYTFGIILILSFIVEFKNVDVEHLRIICYWIIFTSAGVWLLEDLFYMLAMYIDGAVSYKDQDAVAFILITIYYGLQAFVWIYIMRNVLDLF